MNHSSPEFLPAQEKTRLEILQEDFCGMFDKAKKSEAAELFKKIAEKYQAEGRVYHNFEHIENLLSFLKEHGQDIRDQRGVKFAAYFHDVVYDTKAKDNEEQSAQFAQNHLGQLGIPKEIIAHTVALIKATTKHEAIQDNLDSAQFLDGDLAILGSNQEAYDEYALKIRKEYAWVPEDQYRAGRIKVLNGFLKRPRIYFTERAGQELERQARINMEREIEQLS